MKKTCLMETYDATLEQNQRETRWGFFGCQWWLDFSEIPQSGTEDEVVKGICSVVTAMKLMVSALVKKFPPLARQQPPTCLSLFWNDVYKPESQVSLTKIKKIVLYNYSHPLFFN